LTGRLRRHLSFHEEGRLLVEARWSFDPSARAIWASVRLASTGDQSSPPTTVRSCPAKAADVGERLLALVGEELVGEHEATAAPSFS